MQRRKLLTTLSTVALAPVALTACAQPQGSYPPMPAARREQIPPQPRGGDRYVWQPGHWHWNGRAYDWVPGHYVEYSHHRGGRWVPGHWEQRGREQVWVPSHWA